MSGSDILVTLLATVVVLAAAGVLAWRRILAIRRDAELTGEDRAAARNVLLVAGAFGAIVVVVAATILWPR
ncbi:hypothetical protein ACI2IX_10365 [Leifsonia aquatica]|uniref:hypothetical protein n=1 Tax=Leifsonia aquatica TaxID=144185 RepID=UPI00384C1796